MTSQRSATALLYTATVVFALWIAGCNSKSNPTTPNDTTPPAATTDLTAGAVGPTSAQVVWSAPGDDGNTGTASQYDLRYSTTAITDSSFASATKVTNVPAPGSPGTAESVTVLGLSQGTRYYFAVKTEDKGSNWSSISNILTVNTTTTSQDTQAPSAVADLAVGTITQNSVVLSWTAPGNNGNTGTAHDYDLRYSTRPITDASFYLAPKVTGVPAPAAAGTQQQVTVNGLNANTTYYFAMKAGDEASNWSALSNVPHAATSVTAGGDDTPPAAITDLSAVASDSGNVVLTWTAPGDDGNTGTARFYDIRYSSSSILEANWNAASQVSGEPTPQAAGTVQHMTVRGLTPDTDYYFAMKTSDDVPNISDLSNVVLVHTGSTGTAGPMGLFVPTFTDSVCISSSDPVAQQAKVLAQGSISLLNAYSSLGEAFFVPLAKGHWTPAGNGCFEFTGDSLGCTGTYNACSAGTQTTYQLTLNGSCQGQNFNNWVAYRVVADSTARTATFYAYDLNQQSIALAWNWRWAADRNSGGYTFYQGDPSTAPVQSTLDWAKSDNGNALDLTYVATAETKWVGHFEKDPCKGTFQTYAWDAGSSQWWKQNDIAWNADGTGSWDIYNEGGQQVQHRTW